MHIQKGSKIHILKIENGRVTAFAEDGSVLKLTRAERRTLADYDDPDYIENIRKMFSNPHIVSDEFKVIKNGEIVYEKN